MMAKKEKKPITKVPRRQLVAALIRDIKQTTKGK